MNSRLQALIDRGYDKDTVIRLASFTSEELEYASEHAFEHITRNCHSVDNPFAIFIGGQPGCGKTVLSMNIKNSLGNTIEIGIDNYRMYHPRYLEIEKCIKDFWKNKIESENDSPGNDIADFTHYFAGAMTDKLIEMGMRNNYNLLLEWGMREPTVPLRTMKILKGSHYKNIVLFVSTHKEISYDACNLRSDVMNSSMHIIRKVPKSFHDLCVDALPDSINKIYIEGYKNNIIDYMAILSRNNELIWDDKKNELPGDVYMRCLNDYKFYSSNDSEIAFKTNKKEMEGLQSDIHKLNMLKEELVYINPTIIDLVSSKK